MLKSTKRFTPVGLAAALLVAVLSFWGGTLSGARGQGAQGGDRREAAKPLFAGKLPNVPGKTLTAVVVTYQPGGKSHSHRHAGSVFAYVLSGSIRSENSATGPAKVYNAGEVFFEPPGSEHLISENASDKESASLLAVFVADDDARLTSPSK